MPSTGLAIALCGCAAAASLLSGGCGEEPADFSVAVHGCSNFDEQSGLDRRPANFTYSYLQAGELRCFTGTCREPTQAGCLNGVPIEGVAPGVTFEMRVTLHSRPVSGGALDMLACGLRDGLRVETGDRVDIFLNCDRRLACPAAGPCCPTAPQPQCTQLD